MQKRNYFNQVDSEDEASTDVEARKLVVTRTCDCYYFYIDNNNKYKHQTTQHTQHKLLLTF